MKKLIAKTVVACAAVSLILHLFASPARAVDRMGDWTAQNTSAPVGIDPAAPNYYFAPDNNYGLITNTSVGGTIQSKINFGSPVQYPTDSGQTADTHFVYLSDPTLEGPTLDFTTPLHMEGTITFDSSAPTEPNICFCWYASEDTRHRIGLGRSNRTVAQGGASADRLRIDFGYGSTSYPNPNPPPTNLGNQFYYVSPDGMTANTEVNSTVPDGTYSFTFDYTPGNVGSPGGGSISATLTNATAGTFSRTVSPLLTEPEDNDFFSFDRFGIVQRFTANTTQLGKYNVVFSNVDYTGGTEAVPFIPGDFNADQDVDAGDLATLLANYGTGTGVPTGDSDGDGDADGNDFLNVQRFLGTVPPPVTAIPEPEAAVLLAISGIAACVRRRRRRR
jgi:hypothetical protein